MKHLLIRGSLRGRLSRWLALQAAVGLGLVCVAVYIVIAWTLAARQDDILRQKQASVQHLLAEGRGAHDLAGVRHLLNDFLAGHDELSLRLQDADGRLIYETLREMPARSDTKRLDFAIRVPGESGATAHATLTLNQQGDEALLARLAWTLALAALAGTVAVSAGGFWLVGLGLSPLHKLVEQTRRVHALRLDRRLDGSEQAEELQPLIAQFNALLDRLDVAYRQMEAFNADVAHELNTPLATLISSCELALRRPRGAEELCDVLASNLEDLHRMAGIVNDMLFLSNAERGLPARRARVPRLALLAAEVVEFHEAALLEAGLRSKVRGDAAASVDAPLLRRALSNLLGNATRYARPGSCVEVEVRALEQGRVELSVTNEGAVLQTEDLPRWFDRFYRADPARSQADRNHGLGLAIVAAIARMHEGEVFAESANGVTRIGLRIADAEPLRAASAQASAGPAAAGAA